MKILINQNLIEYETDKAFLIKIPGENLKFWISSKMVYPNGNQYSVLLPEKWSYKLIRGKSKNCEEVVDIEYMEDHFSNMRADEVTHHTPDKLEAETKIDDSLIR